MPYLGNIPATSYSKIDKQTITGDGGSSYTLTYTVGNEQEIEVFVNNVRQEPGVAYTVSGTSLNMTGNVTANDSFYVVFQGKAQQTIGIPEKQSDGNYIFNATVTTNALQLSSIISPTEISANTNDWTPGVSGVSFVRVSSNTDNNIEYSITGLEAGANGQLLILTNIDTMSLTMKNEDANSTAANRFSLPDNMKLMGNQTLPLYYDGVSARWRALISNHIPYFHKIALTKGFFSGGYTTTPVTTADRTTYSTETTAAVSGANLSQARYVPGAAGNAEKGFFSGGYTTSAVATADRTNYSTETTAAVSGANLSQARYGLGAAGNAEKGFFSGGYTGSSYVATANRTNYSTETTAAVSGANLSQGRQSPGAAGNAEKGFFSGGYTGSNLATADRTNYSTETTAAVSGANLSQARYALGVAGNVDKGFFSGGWIGSAVATADRTTYSTETTAAVSGANLSQARSNLGAAGNVDKGFFSGGYTGSAVATADRTTYSTETTAAVSGANLSQARYSLAAA